MPITIPNTAPNGIALEYHRVVRLDADMATGVALARVSSYPSEAAYLGGLPLAWQWEVPMGAHTFDGSGSLLEKMERGIVEQDDSPFYGGAITDDEASA